MLPETGFPAQGKLDAPEPGSIHIWMVEVGDSAPELMALEVLTEDEVERANRFRVQDARRSFTTARYSLRRLLSSYIDCPASEVPIAIGVEGKPTLRGPLSEHLSFNISHSGGWVILGFAWGAPVGVDVEIMRPFRGLLEVAERVLAPEEVALLRTLPTDEREVAFFRGWTRKEAVQKARGIGIWDRPSRIASGLGEDTPGVSSPVVRDPESSHVWTVMGIDAPAGYVAAAAVEAESAGVAFLRRIGRA